MSKANKATNIHDSPPQGGSNLNADFQNFCQSPEFAQAFQNNPLAIQFLQQLVPQPAPGVPDSDLNNNIRCIATHMSKSFDDIFPMFPNIQSTWTYYSVNSQFPGYFNPLHFTSWIPAPPVIVPPTSTEVANSLMANFARLYPWAIFMKGISHADPLYGSTLSLMGLTNPSNPLPIVSEQIVDSVDFLSFLYDMSIYYTHNGTTSLDTILRPHFDALKYSINRIKYPEYDITHIDPYYHIGWFIHYHNNNLVRHPHILIQHFKTLHMAKSNVFS